MRLAVSSLAFALGSMLLTAHARAESLLVFSRDGLQRADSETGAVQETLTTTPIAVARMRDATHVVFLTPGSNDLFELDLTTRATTRIAEVPGDVGLGCGGNFGSPDDPASLRPYVVADHVEFVHSMAVGRDHACFEVMDRNLNMASVIAVIDVDLRTGVATSAITLAEGCPAIDEPARMALLCTQVIVDAMRASGRAGRAFARAHTVVSNARGAFLVGPDGARRRLAIEEPFLERVSPNGRWAVLSGNRDEGDYIYRQLWILDLVRGRVFPIAAPEGTSAARRGWPAALGPRALRDAEHMTNVSFGAAGETSVWWRGATLVLGERVLITPGRSIVTLPGALVR